MTVWFCHNNVPTAKTKQLLQQIVFAFPHLDVISVISLPLPDSSRLSLGFHSKEKSRSRWRLMPLICQSQPQVFDAMCQTVRTWLQHWRNISVAEPYGMQLLWLKPNPWSCGMPLAEYEAEISDPWISQTPESRDLRCPLTRALQKRKPALILPATVAICKGTQEHILHIMCIHTHIYIYTHAVYIVYTLVQLLHICPSLLSMIQIWQLLKMRSNE